MLQKFLHPYPLLQLNKQYNWNLLFWPHSSEQCRLFIKASRMCTKRNNSDYLLKQPKQIKKQIFSNQSDAMELTFVVKVACVTMTTKLTGRLSSSNFVPSPCLGAGCEKNGIDREFLRCFTDGTSTTGGTRPNRDSRRPICIITKETHNIERHLHRHHLHINSVNSISLL